MPRASWDNLDDFLSIDDFAVVAVREDGNVFRLILEELYLSRELGTYDVNVATPWATAKACDVADLKKRARLMIDGVSYWLTHDPAPDGTGMARLQLSRAERDAS